MDQRINVRKKMNVVVVHVTVVVITMKIQAHRMDHRADHVMLDIMTWHQSKLFGWQTIFLFFLRSFFSLNWLLFSSRSFLNFSFFSKIKPKSFFNWIHYPFFITFFWKTTQDDFFKKIGNILKIFQIWILFKKINNNL